MYAMASKDDAPIYLNMPTCATVETIGSKKINIRTQGQETEEYQ